MDTTSTRASRTTVAFVILVLAGCGTGGTSGAGGASVPPPTYTVGGSVTGLSGSGLVLRDNEADDLTITSNGSFTFGVHVTSGATYNVAIEAQPINPVQNCVVMNAGRKGSVAAANIATVNVVCANVGRFGYVVDDVADNISAFSIDATLGAPAAVPGSPFAAGLAPQAIAVDPRGKFVYVANSGSNDVSAYMIDATTGALAVVADSPLAAGTSPQAIVVDPRGKFVYVANSGSIDVSAYMINATTGALTPVVGAPFRAGLFPVSIATDLGGQLLYVVNSGDNATGAQGDVEAYSIDATTGALTYAPAYPSGQTASCSSGPPPKEPIPNLADRVSVDPSGRALYVDTVSQSGGGPFIMSVSLGATSSPLSCTPGGGWVIDPSGSYLYGSSVFAVDAATGALTAQAGSTGSTAACRIPLSSDPTLTFDPSGKFAYAACSGNVQAVHFNPANGALTPVHSGDLMLNLPDPKAMAVTQ
jgi:6-phosphogluconolactonase